MRHEERVYLQHMIDCAEEALAIAEGLERPAFDRNRLAQLAAAKLVELIGESAGNLSLERRASHSETAWADIIGMRHRLVHDYFNVDKELLWLVLTAELRPLLSTLRVMLKEIEG